MLFRRFGMQNSFEIQHLGIVPKLKAQWQLAKQRVQEDDATIANEMGTKKSRCQHDGI